MKYGVLNLNHSLVRMTNRINLDDGLKGIIENYAMLSIIVELCWTISTGKELKALSETIKRKVGVYDDSTYANLDTLLTELYGDIQRELVPYQIEHRVPLTVDLILLDLQHMVMTLDVRYGWEFDEPY